MGDAEHAVPDEEGSPADAFIRAAKGLEDAPRGRLAVCCCWAQFWVALVLLFPLRVLLLLVLVVPLTWLQYSAVVCLEYCASSAPADAPASLKPHSAAQLLVLRALWLPHRVLLLLFGIARVRVRDLADKPRGNATVVANHVTALDGPILAMALGVPLTGVVKGWIMGVPVISTVLRAHYALAVGSDGSRGKAANKVAPEPAPSPPSSPTPPGQSGGATAVIAEYQRLCARDPAQLRLVVFPEGTTHAARCLVKFRRGAFVAGEPVQPIALRYSPQHGWTDGLGSHVFGLLTRLLWTVEVVRLPLYAPSEAERSDPQLYADNVQAAIASALELPTERVSTTIGDADLRAWSERQEELRRNRPR